MGAKKQQLGEQKLGYIYGVAAYLCWGAFPLYFVLLAHINPFEIVPWRALTALLFCAVAVTVLRGWRRVRAVFAHPKRFWGYALCTVLLYTNWQMYVFGVVTGHTLETALGYFINPLVTVLIGVLWRGEKLNRLQTAAVLIAAAGVLVSAIAYGRVPFIALTLALSFGFYGAVKKAISESEDALTGFTVETVWGSLIGALQLVLIAVIGGGFAALESFAQPAGYTVLLLLSGTVTAIPLLLFAAGTSRLELSRMGFLQFLAPIILFLIGYLVFDEPMPAARWIAFIAVWIAVTLLVVSMSRTLHTERRLRREARTDSIPVP